MIVVADTSPLHYLVLIGAAGVLEPLHIRVIVPETVLIIAAKVRAWIEDPPAWLRVHGFRCYQFGS